MAALVAAALVAVPRALPAEAQDRRPAPPARQDSGGWLGVGLISFSQCPEGSAGAGDDCRHTLVVGGLVHGGPADRAGLQPGDTLLAVDGTRLTEGLEDGVFGRLSPGDTVSILVGRSDGRTRLDAVPASRPDSLAIVQYHQDGAYLEHRARYFLAIPERSVLDSLVEAASRDPNLTVRTRVRVVPTERVKKIPLQSEPEAAGPPRPRAEARERLAEMRARAREIRRRAVEEAREFGREAREAPEPERVGAEEWKRWVSEELQPRLQVIYDSVLTMARGRMDSLRAMYPAVAARAARAMDSLSAAASRAAAEEGSLAAPRAPDVRGAERPGQPPSPEELGMPGNRIAGAELQPLTPELGEFFGGVERGLVVLEVLGGTPAARLGLRPGDVIVAAAGHPVTTVTGLRHALTDHSDGVEIRWVRRGRSMADTLRH